MAHMEFNIPEQDSALFTLKPGHAPPHGNAGPPAPWYRYDAPILQCEKMHGRVIGEPAGEAGAK